MNKSPLVSILMNCYNGEKYLREAIESVIAQTYQNWELIFWDNQSTDRSGEIFNSYSDPRLKYFLASCHTTLYHARNLALRHTSGDYICFLDVDDTWVNEKLKSQIAIFNKNRDVVLVHSAYYKKCEISGAIRKIVKHHKGYVKFSSYLHSYFINIQSVMIKNIKDIDISFNNDLNLVGDYELFMKLAYLHPTYYIKTPLIISRFDGSNLSIKLDNHWPEEIKIANASIKEIFDSNDKNMEKMLDMKLAKKIYFMSIVNSDYDKARAIIKEYKFTDLKIMLFYLATFSKILSRLVLRLKKN